jgi:hypothetical protein
MGPQQVLRAAACVVLVATATARAERVAVIDLGPGDASTRRALASAVVDGGLEPVYGDGVEDALAGVQGDRDFLELEAAMADAQSKFGALACKDTITFAQTAIALGAARQAAGLAVPELPRAWAYVLLCADRTGDTSLAVLAASSLRALGGSPDVDAKTLDRYPEIDALSNREAVEVEIKTDVPANVFVDFKPVGKSPLKLVLTAGPHIMAAAAGTRRGTVTGTVIRKQPVVSIPLVDQANQWNAVAKRVASWNGAMPSPAELANVLTAVHAKIAIVRHGDTIEAWGHAGAAEPLRRLGNEDGIRTVDEAAELVSLINDRIQTWNDRAPDPDQPLLVEDPLTRRARKAIAEGEEPTKWWVYATIAGAVAASVLVIYAHDSASDTQHITLHYP